MNEYLKSEAALLNMLTIPNSLLVKNVKSC